MVRTKKKSGTTNAGTVAEAVIAAGEGTQSAAVRIIEGESELSVQVIVQLKVYFLEDDRLVRDAEMVRFYTGSKSGRQSCDRRRKGARRGSTAACRRAEVFSVPYRAFTCDYSARFGHSLNLGFSRLGQTQKSSARMTQPHSVPAYYPGD